MIQRQTADVTSTSLRIRTRQTRPSENGPHSPAEVGEAKLKRGRRQENKSPRLTVSDFLSSHLA
ncbi:hypothetical protein THTE_0439 [Thermogutta terrifontis]|uniref:Uncharacterized protein n=1 Tax=Thermogutta terrifontis TaxID=1331910 RepID=A0A286RAR8_9BACT|nr:hypothetical protein THTE_0439 [Thermogutta terrifontis]